MIRIAVFYDGNAITEFEQAADDRDITIGRAPGCSVRLDEASVSRLHALIRRAADGWVLERKASFGAVLLNGQEVENARLEGGEEISIGKFSLRIDIQAEAAQALSASTGSSNLSGPSIFSEDESGRTKFTSSAVNALFRFEPGSANVAEFLMEGEVAVFGRGSNCDVVLTEKKASRKHIEIRRQGLSFFLKDLGSSNGTIVNGSAVSEVELVPGDLIQVGDAKFQFSIENKEYFSQQDRFLPVPSHLENSELAAPDESGMLTAQEFGQSTFAGGGFEGGSAPPAAEPLAVPAPTDIIGLLKYKWFAIPKPQRMRYLTILVVFALISALLGGPDEEPKKKPVQVKRDANGKIIRTVEMLTPKKRAQVIATYKELLAAHEKRDFQKMLELAARILTDVDDYNDTKQFESLAKKGLDEIEEARRQKEIRDRQEAIRREVAALEDKGKAIYEKALDDPKSRPDLDAIIQDIYGKDPNNQLAVRWKEGIKRKDEEERQAAELARQKELLRQKAEDAYANVENIFKGKKYIEALKAANALGEIGYSEKEYLDKTEQLIESIRTELASVIDPLLREALAQRQDGGDLVKANEKYLEVLRIDASNKDALSGVSEIRDTLHLRAKRFYAEAILAESVSDLVVAKDNFEKCLRTAPEDDIYKKRCKNKLSRFDAFNQSGAN